MQVQPPTQFRPRLSRPWRVATGRPIAGVLRRNDALIAGLRVRVGDDVYESSVAGQLSALGSAV
jgi:hypothetical protein